MSVIIGNKSEMTQIFAEDGKVVPVTIIDINEVYVLGKKDESKDGYSSLVFAKGKKNKSTKSMLGITKVLKFIPKYIMEGRVSIEDQKKYEVGKSVPLDLFKQGEMVDVSGTTKGKGFQGVIKKWGFHGGPRTHGQSDRQRAPGSIGAGTTPGRVFKGKKMGSRMGGRIKKIKNLEVVVVDKKNGLIAVKGAVPGNRGSLLLIQKSKYESRSV